jgi:MYXO-CTERM domain-containing protein
MRSRAAVLCLIGAGLILGSCSQPGSENDPQDEDEGPTLEIVGGAANPACSVPMTAKIPGCTATLISPTILLTAKHCGPKAGMNVQFGEKTPFAFTVKAAKCATASDSDAAYCVLPDDERLKTVPTVPVLHGCEYTKFMKVGARILGVGFGDTMGTGPARTKNAVEVPVVRVRDPFIDVGDKTHDLCFGDSGGGAYIHLVEGDKDWGWRVIGTVTGTARVPGGAPCGGTNFTTVLRHIKLVENAEKIDVTPCTDAQGAWAPGADCKDFLTDIRTGGGAWPMCNYGPKTTAPIDSCGDGPGGEGGADGGGGPVVADAAPAKDGPRAADGAADGSSVPRDGASTGAGGAVAADAAGAVGGSGGGGAGGAGGGAGGAGGSDKGSDAAPTVPPASGTTTGGCGCQVGATDVGGTRAAPLALIALWVLERRRRRRTAALVGRA